MTRFRVAMAVYALIVVLLAGASAVTLTALSHDAPLHRAYACAMHKAGQQDWHLPRTPCTRADR